MKNSIIDVRGKLCPLPLMAVKKALKDLHLEQRKKVLTDSEVAKENIEHFLKDNGTLFETQTNDDHSFLIEFHKKKLCKRETTVGKVVAITNDKMGEGSEELGTILMQAFINTLEEGPFLPSHIIFYNSGVKLTTDHSPLLKSLQDLVGLGVNLLVCGTCINFFDLKEKMKVGQISNMYQIMEIMSRAQLVIRP